MIREQNMSTLFSPFPTACIRVRDKVHGDECKGQHQCGKCKSEFYFEL